MSTLSLPMRLLNGTAPVGLAILVGLGLAGCSATSGVRTGAGSKMKTFLAVGDKPLPVVTGEPGSTVAAGEPESTAPRKKARPEGRISGRVFGADGRPVPEARVRLAVGGAPGGKVSTARTDRSGAFTLHNLRPGSTYTVIAEWEGGDGVMTGRANARASDTDVRISLGPQDAPPTRAAAPSRVDRVSDREAADDGDAEGADARDRPEPEPGAVRPDGRVNEEDLPPAVEADAMAAPPERTRPATVARRGRTGPTAPAAWKSGGRGTRPAEDSIPPAGGTAGDREADDRPPNDAPVDSETRGTASRPEAVSPEEDDVPNPLPPAIEPARASDQAATAPAAPDPFAAEPPRVAAREPDPAAETPATTPTAEPTPPPTRPTAASAAFESRSRPTERSAVTPEAPADTAPGALVIVPETFAPVVVHNGAPFPTPGPTAPESPAASRPVLAPASAPAPSLAPSTAAAAPTDPFVEPFPFTPERLASSEAPARPAPATRPSPEVRRSPPAAATAVAPVEAPRREAPEPAGRRRPTWGEVVARERVTTPTVGTAAANAEPPARSDAAVARRNLLTRRTPAPASATTSAPTPSPTMALEPACEYDDRHRRIIDFRLPDLGGKPVQFQDIDADLVLIDFWGTWCQPCLKSIPHLVDLQQRMGRRIAVLGVACEPDTPAKSATRVADTVRRLNVNYPVLLSRNDGSCPLQEALKVQAFPTMVLVDRQGRVLWRDQGATPATLARLDRFLASATPGDAGPVVR